MKTRNLEILIKQINKKIKLKLQHTKRKTNSKVCGSGSRFRIGSVFRSFCWCHYFRWLKNYFSLKENCFCKFFLSSKLTTYPGSGSKLGQNSGSGSKIQCIWSTTLVKTDITHLAILVALSLAVELAGGLSGAQGKLLRGKVLLAALTLPTLALAVLPPHLVAQFLHDRDKKQMQKISKIKNYLKNLVDR